MRGQRPHEMYRPASVWRAAHYVPGNHEIAERKSTVISLPRTTEMEVGGGYWSLNASKRKERNISNSPAFANLLA